jgi:hypothetical protein
MQIPETPHTLEELDLMRQLKSYADGQANWHPERAVGPDSRTACAVLHIHIRKLVDQVLKWVLDRVSAREMDTFTMHDRAHGIKVAHVMWHILAPSRRERLTPPEIGMLVLSAYVHDLGMALSKEERASRLAPESDLWRKLEIQESTRARMHSLRQQIHASGDHVARRSKQELDQMEEALLCQDTRERHATRGRYEQITAMLRDFHEKNPENIPSIDECLSFSGESFREKLIDVCVSHNEDAEALARRDPKNPARPQFPSDFPVASEIVDLHMVAGALRLADILDFDRERTPSTLFYYLIPHQFSPSENRSVLEWGKHMAISSWNIERDAVVFRGRCRDHIIHHAIVQFCSDIQREILETHSSFGPLREESSWPFQLPPTVKAEIHEEGYHYVPYRFELDDQRIYELLMGGAIYEDSRVAVRELIQNAVDACRLRDALTQLHEPYSPQSTNRIFVRYEEANGEQSQPTLTVVDTGIGMDGFIIERYFLRVGQSYYRSIEFGRERIELQRKNLDFAPVSEFGIGFLSCFLLSDRVEVQTAMSDAIRGDTRMRTLLIDGPTRLIRLDEHPNEGSDRFRGTRVTLHLSRGSRRCKTDAPTWSEIREYLENVCQDLPYRLNLEYVGPNGLSEDWVGATPMRAQVPSHLESSTLRIQVNDQQFGLEGEIALTRLEEAIRAEGELFKASSSPIVGKDTEVEAKRDHYRYHLDNPYTELFRGGFRVGNIRGLPEDYLNHTLTRARLRLTWQSRSTRRFITPNLARNGTSDDREIADNVARVWISHLLENVDHLSEGQLYKVSLYWPRMSECSWLEKFDALRVYRLATNGWRFDLRRKAAEDQLRLWEEGSLDKVPLGDGWHELHGRLLELVLPKVCSLVIGPSGGRWFKKLDTNWKSTLQGWRSFVSNPITWGNFVEFLAPIEELLWYDYPGYNFFNSKYKDRLDFLNEEQLGSLLSGLNELAESQQQGRLPILKHVEAEILRVAIEKIGDLKIGSVYGFWRLGSFSIPEKE